LLNGMILQGSWLIGGLGTGAFGAEKSGYP